MNIAEAERRTGLSRANIRFYEKEGLLKPTRGENGYRDYTEDDVQTLRKIMLLRRLRLSVPDIRAIESGEKALPEAAEQQLSVLQSDIRESEQAYAMCQAICSDKADWNGLDVDRYQSITLPLAQDDPREKDRIPPAGCPWRRFLARNIDATWYGLLWNMAAQWLLRINPDKISVPSVLWAVACGYVGWLLMFIFEPLLLHCWGTTVGKWVFGLSVRDEDGNKLSIRTAYVRLWGVFAEGAYYGVPFLELYYNYQCYRVCTEEELPWDLENGCSIIVREREVRVLRVVLYVLLVGLVNLAQYGIDLHAKMPPNRGDLTMAEFVENCNDYLKYNEGLSPFVQSDGSWNTDIQIGGSYDVATMTGNMADVSIETDENGYVKSVTITADSQDGVQGNLERRTVYYAFAASYAKWNSLYTDYMMDSFIGDGWTYDAPDAKNTKETTIDGLDIRYEYEYSFKEVTNGNANGTMPYHSVLTISKE